MLNEIGETEMLEALLSRHGSDKGNEASLGSGPLAGLMRRSKP